MCKSAIQYDRCCRIYFRCKKYKTILSILKYKRTPLTHHYNLEPNNLLSPMWVYLDSHNWLSFVFNKYVMMKNINILLFLFLMPLLSFAQDRESDSLALVQLYNDLSGPNWSKGEGWLSSAPLEEWEGVKTSNDRVYSVELKQFDVNGNFPLSIVEISELTTFEIRNGIINNSIPEELANLPKLNRLILQDCALSGSLPNNLDQFLELKTFIVNINNLAGPLPAYLPSKIINADLSGNQFSGQIPSTWAGHGLNTINLDYNLLEGNFDVLATMPNLAHLDMSDNNWDEAGFPEWLDDLPNLDWFACENCNLVGDLPISLDFSNSMFYDRVLINGNNLSGDISLLFSAPDSDVGVYLRARDNNFSGEFPAHKVAVANQIDVRGNNYTSMSEFDDVSFNRFDISFNKMTFSSLEPVKEYIALDSIIGVLYDPQQSTFEIDTILINEPTEITIEAGDNYPGINYEWYNNGGVMINETGSSITVSFDESSQDNRYRCKMTHPDYPELDLWRSYLYIEVDISTSLANEYEQAIKIYPNPTSEYLMINDPENKIIKCKIIDLDGRLIFTNRTMDRLNIDVSDLRAGYYIIVLYTIEDKLIRRFVKR